MKCKSCGAEIVDDAKFCNHCGTKVEESQNVKNEGVEETIKSNDNGEKYSTKEMIDKIANFITYGLSAVSIIMIIGALFGFFDKNPIPFIVFVGVIFVAERLEEKLPKVPTIFFAAFEIIALVICFNIGNNVGSVLAVKEGSPNQYPNITYEQAFEDYFANPKWESCGKDEDGNEVVMFTGICEYLGSDAIAEIKFTVYQEQESFVVSSVKLNGEDMDFLGNVLIMNVFEEYQSVKYGNSEPETFTETYLEEDVSEMPSADTSINLEEITLLSGTYRNENSKFVFTISEPYYSEENTICVNVYAGIEGDEYRHERVGVVYEPWKEIWTGYGNFEYDGENGLITGQGLSTLIYYFDDEEMDDLEVEYTYYLDSFEVTEEEQLLNEEGAVNEIEWFAGVYSKPVGDILHSVTLTQGTEYSLSELEIGDVAAGFCIIMDGIEYNQELVKEGNNVFTIVRPGEDAFVGRLYLTETSLTIEESYGMDGVYELMYLYDRP